MKRTKFMIAIVLLFSLLLSSCGMTVPQAAVKGVEPAGEASVDSVLELTPIQSGAPAAPAADYAPRLLTSSGSKPAPTIVQTDMFAARFEGDAVAGRGEAVDGAYRFIATETDGEAWHVKLECSYPTVAGRDYRVTYRFRSDVAGKVKFGDFQEFAIEKGENSVTGVLIASGGSSYLDLQLGMLPPFTIDFTEIEVEEYADVVDYENALPAPVNFSHEAAVYEAHDEDYDSVLTRAADAVSVNYRAVSSEPGVWKSRLFVQTGLIPEPDMRYHIAADISCDRDLPYEVLLNNGGQEKGYGALYGQILAAGETKTCEAVITGTDESGELVLQFSLGEAPEGATVTIGNIRAETFTDRYANELPAGFALDASVATGRILSAAIPMSFKNVPLTNFSYAGTDTVYEGHDDGYVVSLEEGASSATLKITQAPADAGERGVWKAKLCAATGLTLDAGATYRIKFDLASTGDQAEYEACFDGDYENAYGALYGRSLTAGGTDSVELIVTPDVSHGPLTLRLQMGKTDTADGNTVTLSNLSVEKLEPQYKTIGEVALSTGGSGNVSEEHSDGVEQTLTASGSSAALNVTQARTDGGIWSSKMIIRTGVTPEAGKKYQFSAKVDASADTGEFEILYQNAASSELYSGQWGLNGSGEYSSEFTAPDSGCGELVLVFQLGNSAAGNTVTVSELKLCEVNEGEASSNLSGLAYPESVPGSTVNNSFSLTVPEGADAALTGNGTSATVTVNTAGSGIVLCAATGVQLEAGKTYQIDMNVEGGDWDVCYAREGGGDYEYSDSGTLVWDSPFTVRNICKPTTTGKLNILLKFDRVAAGSSITVKDITVSEETDTVLSYNLGAWVENNIADSGTEATIAPGATGATATIVNRGAGVDWQLKMYTKPEVTLEPGSTYRIVANVEGAKDCFVHFKDGSGVAGWDETFYGDTGRIETDDKQEIRSKDFEGQNGMVEIVSLIGARQVGDQVTISDIRVIKLGGSFTPVSMSGFGYPQTTAESTKYNSFSLTPEDADAALTGNGKSATVTINTPASGIVLCAATGVALEAGNTYQVDMNVDGGDWDVCYAREGGGDYEYSDQGTLVWDGPVTVRNIINATTSGNLNILLKFDRVAAGKSITVSDISVVKLGAKTLGENLLTDPLTAGDSGNVNFWAHEDYAAALSGDGSSASLAISKTPDNGEAWKVKLFVETGIALEAGKHYRVSADVSASAETDYEVCYNNGAVEKGVGALYGLHASSAAQTAVFEGTPEEAATLTLQFNLGWATAPCTVTVSNVKVEEMAEGEGESVLPSFSYDSVGSFSYSADDGYIAALNKAASSAELQIIQAPAENRNPWNVKLNVKTGFTPEKDKGYRVSFDLDAAKPQSTFELFFDGSSEGAYGQFFGPALAGGKTSFSQIIYPGSSKGELVLQLRFGKTDGTDGNTYTVSNVKIEEVSFNYVQTSEKKEVTTLDKQPDYTERLEKSPDHATVRIEKTPAAGREPWKSKLFVETGVTLKAGQKYRIRMDVTADSPAPFEICFNNGSVEKGLGAIYGLTAGPDGENVEYLVYPKQDTRLVIQLSHGNCEAPNSITLSGLSVEKAGPVELVSDTIYTF